MDLDQILKNIDKNTKAELEASEEFYKTLPESEEEIPAPKPVDLYQRNQERLYEVNQKSFPKGASAIVNIAVTSVIDGAGAEGLARSYERAKNDSDSLKKRGERGRAELVRQQYMQEYFLPAIEIVINSASPDEVLASEKALKELDKYALLEGSGDGYTASYIRQAYGNQLGQVEGGSDASVRSDVRRINLLLDDGDVRSAVGVASRLKEQVDKGEHQASEDDYELVSRICAYYR